jgi:hypothetical protein
VATFFILQNKIKNLNFNNYFNFRIIIILEKRKINFKEDLFSQKKLTFGTLNMEEVGQCKSHLNNCKLPKRKS